MHSALTFSEWYLFLMSTLLACFIHKMFVFEIDGDEQHKANSTRVIFPLVFVSHLLLYLCQTCEERGRDAPGMGRSRVLGHWGDTSDGGASHSYIPLTSHWVHLCSVLLTYVEQIHKYKSKYTNTKANTQIQ